MAPFVYPPIEPDPDPAPLSPTIPLNPPMVGEASPFDHVDGQNRDLILESIRAWVRNQLRAWTTAWQNYLVYWLQLVEDWLNGWAAAADEYITEHAVAGYSWRTTATPIAETGPTDVEITDTDELRPLVVGDLVSDESDVVRYGIITAVIDATHATVTPIRELRGPQGFAGFGWWQTVTPIAHTGTTDVVLTADPNRTPQVHDLVMDQTDAVAYGQITVVTDPTHVTVEFIGTLQGPPGIADTGSFDYTTSSLEPFGDPGDVYQGQMVGQPNMVGAFVITTSSRAWVRVYASEAYMIADENRDILTPLNIADDHGCYLDFVSIPSELDKTLTPGIQFTDIGDGLWMSITNTDVTDPAEIAVHFDYRIFRE